MKRAIRRVSARSTINKIPKASTPEETFKYLQAAKNGNEEERREAVEKLILGHIGLAGSIAARFAAKMPNKSDEILAFAMYKLVDSTNRIASGELMTHHDNYDAYIHVVLMREISRMLNQDYTVRPPTNDPKILAEEIRVDPVGFKDKYTPRQLTECKAVCPAPDQDFEFVVDDLVTNSEFFTSTERKVIYDRIAGYDDTEIATRIHRSKQRVQQIRAELKWRLEYLTGEKA